MAIKIMTVGTVQNDFIIDNNGFSFLSAQESSPAIKMDLLSTFRPHLIILNCCKATFNEISLCSKIRRNFRGPVLITTNNSTSDFEAAMLECGADDILHLPLPKKVLMDHITAHLERYGLRERPDPTNQQHLQLNNGSSILNRDQKSVLIDGSEQKLNSAEFDLLWILALYSNKTVSREDLYRILLKIEYDGLDRCIDNRISRLRKRLGDRYKNHRMIKSIRGEGYMLISVG